MKRTLYTVTAGTYTAIPALQFARRVDVQEDAAPGVGILVKFPQDNFTVADLYTPAEQPVTIGNVAAFGAGLGHYQGVPAQTGLQARAADVYCMVTAVSGTTELRVTEYD